MHTDNFRLNGIFCKCVGHELHAECLETPSCEYNIHIGFRKIGCENVKLIVGPDVMLLN
jgi:hypothetical protein